MSDTEIIDYPRGLTFEKVWAALMENREQLKETDRIVKETAERQKETDRQMKETAEQMKKTDRIIGQLGNRFGELAEHLVAPGITKRFNELGYSFDAVAPGGIKILDEQKKVKAEIDLLLENGETIMAIEVKTRVTQKDIDRHIIRLDILKQYRLKRNDTRTIYGAIAGAVFGSAEKEASLEAGFFVLEQSGDTMKMELPEGFVPRKW